MNHKIILLDVDGTIYDLDGSIPESTKQAISLARQQGHLILLCTGRSKSEIGQELWDLQLDGMIGSAGAFILFNDKVLFNQPMKESAVKNVFAVLTQNHIPFVVETNEAIVGQTAGMKYVRQIITDRLKINPQLAPDFLGVLSEVDEITNYTNVNKILFFDSTLTLEEAQQVFADYTLVPNSVAVYGRFSGEVSEKGMTKAKGIETFLQLTGLQLEDTIAIGDGTNDLQMIQYAHIGIAMGNSVPQLLEKADYVTDMVSNDGIYKAFSHFGLLS